MATKEARDRSIEKEAFVSTCAYLALTGVATFITSRMLPDGEVPWLWSWAILSVGFSLPIVVAVFAAATVRLPRRRLTALYAISLAVTIAAFESLFIFEFGPNVLLLTVGGISCGVWLLFRLADAPETNVPTTLRSDERPATIGERSEPPPTDSERSEPPTTD